MSESEIERLRRQQGEATDKFTAEAEALGKTHPTPKTTRALVDASAELRNAEQQKPGNTR